MKQITAIIRPNRLEAVETALHALPHLPGFTVFKATGTRGHGQDHRFVADEWNPDAHDALVLVPGTDDDAPAIVEAVTEAAHTGHPGRRHRRDRGELAAAVRIRTGERDAAAL